ncbi:uncharacterized protein LOC131433898 [Malaya genurostris]|uniref:uncharacterized protein LOC131433898 n=1 Tax=Malaya genurostris TaxID=325434 RepID=UPI0026F3E927|nr:uncharacterized protein LOC131433898 [Malaya genurostris]
MQSKAHNGENFRQAASQYMVVIFLQIVSSFAVETPEPSSLLRPRDINPHPYENVYDGVSIYDKNVIINGDKFMQNLLSQAPVQFPRLINSASMNALPNPYEKFALKERLAKTERFSGADSLIVKPAYKALAKHAARVLNNQVVDTYEDNEIDNYREATNLKKHYVFSYAVKDAASGDDFSHTQQQQVDGAVKGRYKVQLPDGRMQIVKYIADNNGYRADVTYENEPSSNALNHVTAAPGLVQVTATPTASHLASAEPIYNYYKNLQQRQRYVQASAPIRRQHPQQTIYYQKATPTQIPAPYYPSRLRVNNVKIHSYNTAPHAGNLIQSTITPATGRYISYQPSTNLAFVSTTANPVQLQSNTLARSGLIPVVVTTAGPSVVPYYRDINITPPSAPPTARRTSIFDNRESVQQAIYTQVDPAQNSPTTLDYDYVQIPNTNHVYKRNTDKDGHIITDAAQSRNQERSKTDTSAEHEAFSNMKQKPEESAVSFHARLMEKVRLCGYSQMDQERFVRAQLLKGLKNRELAKAARTYGYVTNFIVQSATREEAYEAEVLDDMNTLNREAGVLAIQHRHVQRSIQGNRKRTREDDYYDNRLAKRYRNTGRRFLGQRSRCSRCNRPAHPRGQICPAFSKRCNTCNEIGHFAATCRRKRIDTVEHKEVQSASPSWSEEEPDDKKVIDS